ncbi:MAG: glycoside hydrolase family 28 protein [Candidatus Cryptobacteroides sp.]
MNKTSLKIYALLAASAAVFSSCSERQDIPEGAKKILEYVHAPQFRNADYLITDFGAVSDSTVDSRVAINAAIRQCSNDGGGRVVVPAGYYLSKGPIILQSNVNLHVGEGATILFGTDPKDYLPPVLTVWEGTEVFNYSPLIYAYHCNNVALTGKGTVDGRASDCFAQMRPQRSDMQGRLRQMGIDRVPVNERCFGEESMLPPNMIEPFGCKNVLIEDVTILDSPYWVIHPTFCDNVIVRGVTIESYNRNNDGCDPEYTTNVLIENCTFRCGDDAIAIKAGRDQDAWRIGQKTAGIVIRNCHFYSKCNGLCIGSEMAAGVENVYMYDTVIENCHSGIYFKSNLDRGGFIRNVWVNNIVCDHVRTAFINFYTNYHGARGGFYPTTFENFVIQNVKGNASDAYGFYLVGIEGYPIKNITLKNVDLKEAAVPYQLEHFENVVFDNVTINGRLLPMNPEPTEDSPNVILKD